MIMVNGADTTPTMIANNTKLTLKTSEGDVGVLGSQELNRSGPRMFDPASRLLPA